MHIHTGLPGRRYLGSHGAQPISSMGQAVTSGAANTYGSYASVITGSSLTHDAYGFYVEFSSMATSGQVCDTLLTLGKDEAGGSTFTDWISDLVVGPAQDYNQGHACAVWFYFPIFVKAGTSIGAKVQCTRASTAGQVQLHFLTKPRFPESIRLGADVDSIGVDGANSCGTAVTPGTTAEGNWFSLGTAANDYWFIQVGVGDSNAIAASQVGHIDLAVGDVSNKRIIGPPIQYLVTTLESIVKPPHSIGFYCNIKAGETIYARAQISGATTTGLSVAAYGVR